MRIPEELDYLEEPDIFHEFFGHLPLLTWRPYADFLEKFGQIALKIDRHLRRQLFRIFWFTAEFGLIKTDKGMKVYGAGILSSYGEISRAIEATNLEKLPFDILTCARTDYRYDTMQSKYFFIESFDTLFSLFENDITPILEEALSL